MHQFTKVIEAEEDMKTVVVKKDDEMEAEIEEQGQVKHLNQTQDVEGKEDTE